MLDPARPDEEIAKQLKCGVKTVRIARKALENKGKISTSRAIAEQAAEASGFDASAIAHAVNKALADWRTRLAFAPTPAAAADELEKVAKVLMDQAAQLRAVT